jgi:hypothetical protein
MKLRMSPEEENKLFLEKCAKEKISPSKELFSNWKKLVELREKHIQSMSYKDMEKERIRRQQRTVDQTISEDGAVISPIDEKAYTSKRAWNDHIKSQDVVEIGNENAKKRKK